MFVKNDDDEIPFHNAVKCAISTITDKIISSENDLIGVCFYGTVCWNRLTCSTMYCVLNVSLSLSLSLTLSMLREWRININRLQNKT
jgi:hypothetical protein